MKLAYSSNAFTRTTLADALNTIAAIGFDGAEILCDHPHLFPGRTSAEEIESLRRQLASLSLGVSNLNANTANGYFDPLPPENVFEPSLSSASETSRRWRTEFSMEAIRLASALGATCVSLTSGHPGSGGTPEKGKSYFVDSLKRVCEVAEAHEVQVGIEYEPGLLVERASEVVEMIDRVGSPRLGVNLDLGHSWLSGEAPEEAIEALTGRIWNVHVEDIADQKHFHLVPGDGDMPLGRYLLALEKAGYENYLTVELYTYRQAPETVGRKSFEYLRKLLQKATHE